MKKFKIIKLVAMMLVFSLVFSNVAMAKKDSYDKYRKEKANWSKKYEEFVDKYKKWDYKYTKKFEDVEREHWANKAIERMGVKNYIVGDGKGKFLPNKPTKNIEAITMIIRIMGWEKEAKAIDDLPDAIDDDDIEIPGWGIGYIALAYEKGIITEDELEDFNANAPVKRYAVAKYIIRALGLGNEADEKIDENVDFEDDFSIPEGNKGYIYYINKLGLMSGYNKLFNPMKNLTRAEMAILFSRLDNKVETEEDEVEMGKFSQINNGIITIKKDNETERYLLSENVIVYDLEGKEITLNDISENDEIQLEFFDHKVVYIELIKEKIEKIQQIHEGKVSKIVEKIDGHEISILITNNDEEQEKTFVIVENTTINKEDVDTELQLSDIQIGDIVKVTEVTEGDNINVINITIKVKQPTVLVEEGVVVSLAETISEKFVTINIENTEKTFVIEEGTIIKNAEQDLGVGDIKIGDVVRVTKIIEMDIEKINLIEILN
jgi:hypothetical protein